MIIFLLLGKKLSPTGENTTLTFILLYFKAITKYKRPDVSSSETPGRSLS